MYFVIGWNRLEHITVILTIIFWPKKQFIKRLRRNIAKQTNKIITKNKYYRIAPASLN